MLINPKDWEKLFFNEKGGFYERLDSAGKSLNLDCRLHPAARMLFVFSSLAIKSQEYLPFAHHAEKFLQKFRTKKGYIWKINEKEEKNRFN